MVKRESYMKRIRPFFRNDLVKALIGLHRSGKSVMLDLIKEELRAFGVDSSQFISINFENMNNALLCTAVALHDEIIRRASEIKGKVYLFFDEIQEVDTWEKCINSFRVELDCDIYITGSNAKLLSGELATYLAGRYVEFVIYPFSFAEFIELYRTIFPNADIRQCFSKYMELLRRGYTVTVGKAGDKEIDFVCEDQGNKLYIQVAYLLASEDTIEREFGVYDRVRDNFPKYVITLDEFDMSRNGIKHRNIRDFLLQKEWN